MEPLREKHTNLINELTDIYERDSINLDKIEHRFVGIVGSRGVGKTTYILNYIKKKYGKNEKALYITADDIYFTKNNLVDLAWEFVHNYEGELLCIDEIHRYQNWAQELKNIFDTHSKLRVVFSGSSSIDLIKEKFDLSRRAVLRHMRGLSFREYLEFKDKIKLPKLTLKQIISGRSKKAQEIQKIP